MGVRQPGKSNLLPPHSLNNRENPRKLGGYNIFKVAAEGGAGGPGYLCGARQDRRAAFVRLGIRELLDPGAKPTLRPSFTASGERKCWHIVGVKQGKA